MSWTNYGDVLRQLTDFGLLDAGERFQLGRIVRCKVEGDRLGQRSGWYKLHEWSPDGDTTLICGTYGNWREGGVTRKIEFKLDREMTRDERDALRKRLAADRKAAEAERRRQADTAAALALAKWKACSVSGSSDYLTRKQVGAHGVRFTRDGALVVPMRDIDGRVRGLQFILGRESHAEKIRKLGRDKNFWPRGIDKSAGLFHLLGQPGRIILLAEGYATAASLHEATQLAVAVCFDAGSLMPVAEALKKRYSAARLLLCADDDFLCRCPSCQKNTPIAEPACIHCGAEHSRSNTGIAKASAAALAVGGSFVAPLFADRGLSKLTDWNDLHCSEGMAAVRSQLEAKIADLGWSEREPAAGGAGAADIRRSQISVEEGIDRFVWMLDAKDVVWDRWLNGFIPKPSMYEVLPDHAVRVMKAHPDRKLALLEDVVFDPRGSEPGKLNLWSGWPTTPSSQGSCDNLVGLLEYMCSGESNARQVFDWVIRWLAYPVQNPGAKMRTALVFHGPQGAGKNIFFESIKEIYGRYGFIIGQDALEDTFTDWLSAKLFLIANEVVARQELFHTKNRIKGLITEDTIRIRAPYVKSMWERNHANLVFLSNEAQPLVLEQDDRRFMVVWTPKPKDESYYRAAAEEAKNGGIAALHDYLLNVDLGDFCEHTKPLRTKAKNKLIDLSKESPDRFIDEWLRGELSIEPAACSLSDLYRYYERWIRDEGERFAYAKNKFSSRIGMNDKIDQAKKPVLQANGNSKVTNVVLPANDNSPGKLTWMEWLGERVRSFADKVDA